MSEGTASERRRHERRSRKFVVKFRVIGGALPKDIADRAGQVVNVSKGGIMLLSKRPLPAGTLLDLKFPESVFGGGAVTLQGVVRRAGTGVPGGDNPLGLAFVRVTRPEGAGSGGSEKRRQERIPEKLLLKLRGVSEGLFHEFEPRGGILLNVSDGGLEVSTTRDYAPGTLLELALPATSLGPARRARATVVRSQSGEKEGHFRLGLALQRGSPGTA